MNELQILKKWTNWETSWSCERSTVHSLYLQRIFEGWNARTDRSRRSIKYVLYYADFFCADTTKSGPVRFTPCPCVFYHFLPHSRRLVLGRVEADDCKEILILQHYALQMLHMLKKKIYENITSCCTCSHHSNVRKTKSTIAGFQDLPSIFIVSSKKYGVGWEGIIRYDLWQSFCVLNFVRIILYCCNTTNSIGWYSNDVIWL